MVNTSPYVLAALATHALPHVEFSQVSPCWVSAHTESASLIDVNSERWVVQCANTTTSKNLLEKECRILDLLTPLVAEGKIPFEVPAVKGQYKEDPDTLVIVYPEPTGLPIDTNQLHISQTLLQSLIEALAAVHDLPVAKFTDLDLPQLSAQEQQNKYRTLVETYAGFGELPATLQTRWLQRINEDSIWKFTNRPVHTNLSDETINVRSGIVSSITDWSDFKLADPATDISWLLSAASEVEPEQIIERYNTARNAFSDEHLLKRALFLGEIALLEWLDYGKATNDPETMAEARTMLHDLATRLV